MLIPYAKDFKFNYFLVGESLILRMLFLQAILIIRNSKLILCIDLIPHTIKFMY